MALVFAPFCSIAMDKGVLTGGQKYDLPDWFIQGFLDFDMEVSAAEEEQKQVIAFLHLDECPYCVRMLDENFRTGKTRDFIEQNFHVVGINIKGDLEVVWSDGKTYRENSLARHLKIFGTPTVVFLSPKGENVLQLNGYRDPVAFRLAVDYVSGHHYRSSSFSEYLVNSKRQAVYSFAQHPLLQTATYLKDYPQALVVLFEDQYCGECARYHDKTLNHPDVLNGLKQVLFVRLDADSDQRIVTPEGKFMTPRQWMDELGLSFKPSLVMYNEGRELFRADGIKYHHHLSEGLSYVNYGFRKYPKIGDFKKAYRAALMDNGINVDFSE